MEVRFVLNGREVKVDVKPTANLADVLRQQLGVTSVKKGCETGDCGSCAVLLDGELVNSCIVLAPTVEGKSVTTVEGLIVNGEMDAIQKSLVEHHGTQCGFCTPGMVLAIKALLNKNPKPTEQEIRRAISGNLCRCTGYQKIVEAVKSITV
ncbi:MAG TPA: (2Fe-2S)-binding protein [Clostridia bacterium]|nr:(2Fe-2S)-binding protein [Clostridia bacterium]